MKQPWLGLHKDHLVTPVLEVHRHFFHLIVSLQMRSSQGWKKWDPSEHEG